MSMYNWRGMGEILWSIKRDVAAGVYPAFGICIEMGIREGSSGYIGHERMKVREFMRDWPEYSGNPIYPVPSPRAWGCLGDMYGATTGKGRWTKAYGSSRMRLLNYLIRRVEAEHAKQAS